jgi:hypothetical protein
MTQEEKWKGEKKVRNKRSEKKRQKKRCGKKRERKKKGMKNKRRVKMNESRPEDTKERLRSDYSDQNRAHASK